VKSLNAERGKDMTDRKKILIFAGLCIPVLLMARGEREVQMKVMGPDCGMEIVYRWTSMMGGTKETYSVHAEKDEVDGVPVYHSISEYEDRTRCISMRQSDLTPVFMKEKWYEGESLIQRVYKNDEVHVIRRALSYPIDEKIEAPAGVHDPESFAFLLKGYPFEDQDTIAPIDVLVAEPNPFFKPRPLEVYIIPLGEEKITVPAGTFDCYVLEMGLAGILGYITPDNIFWLLKEYPHLLVKAEGAGELVELVAGPFKCDGKDHCKVGAEVCEVVE
jgi:hypothetical protein